MALFINAEQEVRNELYKTCYGFWHKRRFDYEAVP